VNLAIGGLSGLSSFFAGSILVLYFGLDIGAGPIAWAAAAIGIAIAYILDFLGFDLFGCGSAQVIPPGRTSAMQPQRCLGRIGRRSDENLRDENSSQPVARSNLSS
jgi:hypothetical protein